MTDDELRCLQQKAYGGGEELSPAEAERLQELQDAVRRAQRLEPDEGTEREAVVEHEVEETVPQPHVPLPRRRIALVAGAAVLASLAAGWGIGTALFESDTRSFSPTAATETVQAALETRGEFDPGSVQARGETQGITIWEATQHNGATPCLILTDSDGAGADFSLGSARCGASTAQYGGEENKAVVAEMTIPREENQESPLGAGVLQAVSLVTVDGERAFFVDFTPGKDPEEQLQTSSSPTQLAIIDELSGSGFRRYETTLLGQDGAVSAWAGWRDSEYCVAFYNGEERVSLDCVGDEEDNLDTRWEWRNGHTTYLVQGTGPGAALFLIERNENAR